jgi:hypothetical protein
MTMDEKDAAEVAARDFDSARVGVVDIDTSKQSYVLKMDLRLIPILGCTYTILFLDRTNSGSRVPCLRLSTDKL